MDIVFNIDNKYAPFMCTTMLSILEHCNKNTITFHILTIELNEENKKYITTLSSTQNCEVKFYDVNIKLLKGFPIGKGTVNPNYPYTGYLRLLISEIIPNSIDKVLYLDCDIIVKDDITELWNMDISKYCVAAVDDYGENGINGVERLIGIKGYTYFNAGVLLINLKMMREYDIYQQSRLWISANYHKVKFHDQDVLNALLYNKRIKIDSRWNHMTNFGDGIIIHFAGVKPWLNDCINPQKKYFLKYLRQTPWKDVKFQCEIKKQNTFKIFCIRFLNKLKEIVKQYID